MFINVTWKEKFVFEAETESTHKILLDAQPEVSPESKGPQPIDLLLVSLAGCAGMDVVSILKKKRVNLQNMTVKVNGERAPEHPKYFTSIDVEFNIQGKDIKEEDIKQAIELSRDKYCSVAAMLKEKATISYRWNIVNE